MSENRRQTRTGGRGASLSYIPGDFALSVGMPPEPTPPDGWQWTKLTDVARMESGHTPSRKHPEYWDGDIPWIGIKDAKAHHGRMIHDTQGHTNQLGIENSSARVLPAGTVCLSRTASVGYVVVMGREMATSQDFVSWICGKNLAPRFLQYLLIAEKNALLRFGTGAVHKTIYYPEVKAFHVCLPPLAEQKRIVAILDEAFETIGQAEVSTRQAQELSVSFFSSAARSIFETLMAEHGCAPLGEVCENLDSRRVPITRSKREPGDIPYYGASGVVDHVAGYLFDEELLLVSEDGANLLARTYPIAFSISGKSWVNNHAHVLRFANRAQQSVVEYYLNSIDIAEYVSGMAQPKLNQRALNRIPVPWVTPPDAKSVVHQLDQLSESVDALVGHRETRLTAMSELRRSLLSTAFCGELTRAVTRGDAGLVEATA